MIKMILIKLAQYSRLAYNCLFFRPKTLADVPPQYYLSITTCVKNEGRYLREWIEYHLWAGVDHFYIYDNGSTDNTKEVLAPYVSSGVVTYHYWAGKGQYRWSGNQQLRMYRDAVARYKYCTKWMALIDADEFIALSEEGKRQFGQGGLANFFKQHEQYPAIGINWICFDGGGHETMPKSGYIIGNYTRAYKDQNAPQNRAYKSVVQPLQVKRCSSAHFCLYKRFRKGVDENLRPPPLLRYRTKSNSTRLIRINHYYTKSKDEFLTKVMRGHPDKVKLTYDESNWAFPEWKADDSMKEAVEYLRGKGVPETYGI